MYEKINKVCNCKDVVLTFGGCSRLNGVVKISKKNDNDGKKAIQEAFNAHKSMKHVMIVDEDIDIHDINQVEWSLATRFQAKEDLIIMHDQKGSSLDPSSNNSVTSKLGFDCTIKGDKNKFKKIF